MFTAELITIANQWKQPKHPLTDEIINKMWYIHTMGSYSALKRTGFLTSATICCCCCLASKSCLTLCDPTDTTEQLHFHFSLSCIEEGNGNPLQCSCLENPRDRGAWWAVVYGVTQSRTWLKRLSSSSSKTIACQILCPWDFPGKYTRVGCHFFLQGLLSTQGWNLHLLLWQADSLPLRHQGSHTTVWMNLKDIMLC